MGLKRSTEFKDNEYEFVAALEGTSDMPAADNVKVSSITNNFGPNYSIDLENELGTLDFGSANTSMEAEHDTTSVAVNSDSAQDEKGA